jgi:hypothetical protein
LIKHPEEWPAVHVIVAIRQPEADSTKQSNEAFSFVEDIAGLNRRMEVIELQPMALRDAEEAGRPTERCQALSRKPARAFLIARLGGSGNGLLKSHPDR